LKEASPHTDASTLKSYLTKKIYIKREKWRERDPRCKGAKAWGVVLAVGDVVGAVAVVWLRRSRGRGGSR